MTRDGFIPNHTVPLRQAVSARLLPTLTHRAASEDRAPDSSSSPSNETTPQKASCCVTEPAAPPREASCCSADAMHESEIPATASEHQLPGSCCASVTAVVPSLSPPAMPPLHDPAEICSDYESLAAAPPSRSSCCSPAGTLEPLDASESEPAPDPEPGSRRTVVLSAMFACGGIASGWLSGGIAIVAPLHAAMTPLELLPAGSLPLVDETSPTVFSAPDLPPPRALAG